jgi:tetratricopeptide (TPR) repeat protein
MTTSAQTSVAAPPRKKYVRAVGPRLRILLQVVFGLFALLSANSLYLISITGLERAKGASYQGYFYQFMFLGHLAMGLLLILPFLIFGVIHIRNTWNRPNRRAVLVGYALFVAGLVLLISGVLLARFGVLELKNPKARSGAYWAHILSPLAVVWLYVLHRLAGPRIKWRVGGKWALATAGVVAVMVWFNAQDPRKWNQVGPKEGVQYFSPSLARTASGKFIPAKVLMNNDYCLQCHKDNFDSWFHSAHHFSSFNNKPYLFSVRETRQVALKRDGSVQAARWCAGCHDPAPFFSGAFDNPKFDDVHDPTSQAGITCTACHAITNVNSTRGNADYTIEEPVHYPFAFSDNKVLQYVNRQLIKAKPEFHKQTFLKPLHKTAEFCATCHKVSIPGELNHYKEFLRGQNHYDTYLLSGVSGHGARSFYYPEQAKQNCAACHMTPQPSADFGAKYFDATKPGVLTVHDHLFAAANTALPFMRGDTQTLAAEQAALKGVARIDLFGIKEGGQVDAPFTGPVRPMIPAMEPGKSYLLETVVRTMKLGHPMTQGTVDSNEMWVEAIVTDVGSGKIIGRSGGRSATGDVDPWSHFINVYMLDRDGNRIDRRNPQDIFTPLYDHQIPPGAAQVVHYGMSLPADQKGPVSVELKLQYRKFDARYMRYVNGADFVNNLPITTIATDRVIFPVRGGTETAAPKSAEPPPIAWQRWNDYGIGLLLEGSKGSEKGELIQASAAFAEVEKMHRADGAVNLARVYFKEGRLDDAATALQRAAKFDPPAPPWTVNWLNGLVDKQNGYLDKAIEEFSSVVENRFSGLAERGFDFSKDYEILNELGQALFERAKLERDPQQAGKRRELLEKARAAFDKTLALDSENLTAHYTLALIADALGDQAAAAEHRKLHERYRPDDNARDRAVAIARQNDPAADHAAQATIIYNLQRPGAPGLVPASPTTAPVALHANATSR